MTCKLTKLPRSGEHFENTLQDLAKRTQKTSKTGETISNLILFAKRDRYLNLDDVIKCFATNVRLQVRKAGKRYSYDG